MKEVGKISDLCTVIAGQSPAGSSYNEKGVGIEFHQGKKAFGNTTLMPSGIWTMVTTKLALPGDILMSVRAPVGPTNMTDRQVCIGRGLAAIRCKEGVIPSYVLYALRNIESKIIGNDGAVFNSINKKMIEDLPLPLLTLSEQEEIVTYLDTSFAKIDAIKANAEKELEEAKKLFAAALNEAMTPKEGWVEKTLGEITNKISDGSHNPPIGLEFSKYEMLSSKNVRNDVFNFENPRYLSKEDFEKEDKRTNIERGDILLTIVGAGLGDCCVYDYDRKIVFQRSVSVIKPSTDKILSRFLMFTLQFNLDRLKHESNGAAQKGIYLKQLASYRVIIPPLSDQHSIVTHLDTLSEKVRQLQSNYEKISSECDALKQAILRDTFE